MVYYLAPFDWTGPEANCYTTVNVAVVLACWVIARCVRVLHPAGSLHVVCVFFIGVIARCVRVLSLS